MATTTWARTEEANIGLLNEKLKRQMYHKTFWSRFAGFTKLSGEGKDQRAIPSGMPIEIMRDFVKEGMDFMLMPMLLNLTGTGIYGDKQLEGNEELLDLYYNKVYINQIRNGIKLGGRMSQQRLKSLQIERERQPLLSEWLANWNEIQIARTFYEGWDAHISAATASGGIYINSGQKRCHPNFFTAGSGQSTYSATDATYEGTLDDDLTNLTDTASDYMSVELIEAMRVEVTKLKIKPMVTESGWEFWPWLIHSNQARQLRADSDWKAAQRDVGPRDLTNPIFRGNCGHYGNFVFFERLLGVFGANPAGTSSTVTFGATNPLSGLDTYPRKCSIIFGRGAISRGVAEDPFFEREAYDYNNVTGIGVGQIVGDARGEYNDSTSSPTAVINETSCIVATYSGNSFA
jgi:hypothetical protein